MGAPIRLSADFSIETLRARGDWHEVFKVMKSKNLQPRLLYPARLSFRMEKEIECPKEEKTKNSLPLNHYYNKCQKSLL